MSTDWIIWTFAKFGIVLAFIAGAIAEAVAPRSGVMVGAVLGGLVSIAARQDRNLRNISLTFILSVFAGWFGTDLVTYWWKLPEGAVAAVLAFAGRDLMFQIMNLSRDPAIIFRWISIWKRGQ